MKAIIPTGGRGTRMQPLTFSTNKHFIPVANKPLIYYAIEAVAEAGIKDVAITYNPGWLDTVKKYLSDGSRWGLNFTYILQENPAGLADVVRVCQDYMKGDKFLFHLGDNIFTKGIKKYTEEFKKSTANGLVTMVHHEENSRLGVPYFDKKGRLIKYVEKPKNPPHDFAVPGLYYFDESVFRAFTEKDKVKPSARGEYEISSLYQWLLDHKLRVDVIEYEGKWLDPGKFNDWIEANQYLLDVYSDGHIDSKIDKTSSIQGRVRIGKGCVIKNSNIRGPVIIGDKVQLVDTYIGPYTSISDNCDIEASSVENSVLMQGVKIIKVKQPIDNSLIGTEAEVSDVNGHTNCIELFLGEKSQVRL